MKEQERRRMSPSSEWITLPTVDVSSLLSMLRDGCSDGSLGEGEAAAAVRQTLRDLEQACEFPGMFHITGYGLYEEDVWARAEQEARRFFQWDLERKNTVRRSVDNARGFFDDELTKNCRDAKQCFDFGRDGNGADIDGQNRWPEGAPSFRKALETYFEHIEKLAFVLTRGISLAMGQPTDTLDKLFVRHTSFLRFNYYVPQQVQDGLWTAETPPPLGVHHHTDAGFFTLLRTDGVPGLEIYIGDGDGSDLDDPGWRKVQPVADAICFNVSDMLQVASRDRFRSALHRVSAISASTRLSAAFFWNPGGDYLIPDVLFASSSNSGSGVVSAKTLPPSPLYRPFTFEEFRRRRFEGDFSDHGKEVQISEYRIQPSPSSS